MWTCSLAAVVVAAVSAVLCRTAKAQTGKKKHGKNNNKGQGRPAFNVIFAQIAEPGAKLNAKEAGGSNFKQDHCKVAAMVQVAAASQQLLNFYTYCTKI